MKILASFSILLCGLLFLTSCGKEVEDHRWKYVGDWEFTVQASSFNIDSMGTSSNETYTHHGKIIISDCCDEIGFDYGSGDMFIAKVDSDGKLYDLPTHYCSGAFEGSDKVHIFLRWGGLGGNVTNIVDGVKK